MSGYDVDLFVIGAGSGGVRAARIAAGYGARVMVAEEFRVGGTCVIRGCVPKKILVMASRYASEFEAAESFGWTVGTRFDWSVLITNKNREISRLEGIYRTNLEKSDVEIIDSRVVVEDAHTVRIIKTGASIRAERILIATGGSVVKDSFPGAEYTISSNEVFDLPELPKRILIIGGGYIAVEFAGVFAGLGSQVTLVHRRDKLLRGFDEDVRSALTEAYGKHGVSLKLSATVQRIDHSGTGSFIVTFSDGMTLEVDQVLSATGRKPNTAGLGLEEAGVELDKKGAVVVNASSQSTVPSIYAVGDVTNRANLTPVAIREGHAFADHVFGGQEQRTLDYDLIPTAVFSSPEVGTVGLSEEEARVQFADVDIYKTSFRPMRAAFAGQDEKMLMKIIVDKATDKVLGVHIVGPDAGEMIQLAGIAMTMGATKADFDRTVAVHPTAAEELVTMRTPV
ncbi:glutathione-disulfide reductase [Microvirga sp. W0021]|uniref:Glutathione reductase n=1 Tax=Hohaiivirga grylli TaxID=3133970 RepID=A0ABV0BIT7_9HYPH